MKETTRIFLEALVNDYNEACKNKNYEDKLEYGSMLTGALTSLKSEGIETPEIVFDNVLNYFSTIHFENKQS